MPPARRPRRGARRGARAARARMRRGPPGRTTRRAHPRRRGPRARPEPRRRDGRDACAWRSDPATRATLTRRTRAPPWPCFVRGCVPVHSEPARAPARTRAVLEAIERGVQMHKGITALVIVGLLAAAAAVGATTLGPANGTASSHREAPLIAEDPSADLTDLYAFRSPDKANTVTLLANVIPGEDPAAGPNWYTFSPGARYSIKIDTDGDVKPNVIYRFQFQRKTGA